jgi:hypothetical protein
LWENFRKIDLDWEFSTIILTFGQKSSQKLLPELSEWFGNKICSWHAIKPSRAPKLVWACGDWFLVWGYKPDFNEQLLQLRYL